MEGLKFHQLFLLNHSSPWTNQAENTVFVHSFLNMGLEIFLKSILYSFLVTKCITEGCSWNLSRFSSQKPQPMVCTKHFHCRKDLQALFSGRCYYLNLN